MFELGLEHQLSFIVLPGLQKSRVLGRKEDPTDAEELDSLLFLNPFVIAKEGEKKSVPLGHWLHMAGIEWVM